MNPLHRLVEAVKWFWLKVYPRRRLNPRPPAMPRLDLPARPDDLGLQPSPPEPVVERTPPAHEPEAPRGPRLDQVVKRKREKGAPRKNILGLRESILDELDRYFVYLARLQKSDKPLYALFSRVGMRVGIWDTPHDTLDVFDRLGPAYDTLSPWWRTHRPAFGAMCDHLVQNEASELNEKNKAFEKKFNLDKLKHEAMDKNDPSIWENIKIPSSEAKAVGVEQRRLMSDKTITLDKVKCGVWPKFYYFHKFVGTMPRVFPIGKGEGDLYLVGLHWDNPRIKKLKKGGQTEYAVLVRPSPSNEVFVLPMRETLRLKATREVIGSRWGFDHVYRDWAHDHRTPVEMFLRRMFVRIANHYEEMHHSMIEIRARKNGLVGTFSVDILATPRFFDDRQATVMKNGTRAPIFHIVRTHPRVTPSGKTTHVRCHFRGERTFQWNGYEIEITVPGLDHTEDYRFDVPCVDESYLRAIGKAADGLELGELAAKLEGWREKELRDAGIRRLS